MLKVTVISPVFRAILVVGAVMAIATGATFAALQSSAALEDNSIATGTATLRISKSATCETDADGTYAAAVPGFDFAGVVPGGAGSQTEEFCLRNVGTANLSTVLGAPALPTYQDSGAAPVTVDNSKVHVVLTCTTSTSDPFGVSGTLQAIWFTNVAQGTLDAGDTAVCSANVTMDADAFTADSVTSTDFDLAFTGTGV
jgi:predicted ribosomally synthesized peptide with SipW-like signal peptide